MSRSRYLGSLALVMLLIPLSGQDGCTPGGGGGGNNPDLATFTDPQTGQTTQAVRDSDEDVLQFNIVNDTLISVGDGKSLPGYVVTDETINSSTDAKTYHVRFGDKQGVRRAYLTEGSDDDTATVVNVHVVNDVLETKTTILLVPKDLGTAQAHGNGIYPIVGTGGVRGLFMFDIKNGYFLCSAAGGGTTIGTVGNFYMQIVGTGPIDRVNFGTVLINGVERKHVQFTGKALSVTVNNDVMGFPGDDSGGEVLVDELIECTYVAEAVEDPVGGNRWRTTIYDATIWPDGSQFKNFDGDNIATATVDPFINGEVSITLP